MSAIRGDFPFDRTFIPVVVPFSVFLGALLSRFVNLMRVRYLIHGTFMIIFVIAYISFFQTVSERDKILAHNIDNGIFEHNILVNYFQKYYTPLELMNEFIQRYEEESVVLLERAVDDVAMPAYMSYWAEVYGRTIRNFHTIDGVYPRAEDLQSSKTIYIITKRPDAVQSIEGRYPEIACVRITSPGQWGMVLRCNHRMPSSRPTEYPLNAFQPRVSLSAWYPAERSGVETHRRLRNIDNRTWLLKRIWLVNPYNTPIHVMLELTAVSYDGAQPVELWQRTHRLARWEVQQEQRTYRVGIMIAPGRTFLHLRAPANHDLQSQHTVNIAMLRWQVAEYVAVEQR